MPLSYLAGFFDGEGHVSIMRTRDDHNHGHPTLWLRIGVSCTYPQAVMEFKRRFGGSVHLRIRRSPKHNDCYDWVAQHRKAAACLLALKPWLHVKRRDADIGIEFQRITRPNIGWPQLSEQERTGRENLRLRLIEKHGLATRAKTA